jgi:hypothetical protein
LVDIELSYNMSYPAALYIANQAYIFEVSARFHARFPCTGFVIEIFYTANAIPVSRLANDDEIAV